MTPLQAAIAIREQAEAARKPGQVGVWTVTGKESVMLGIATDRGSLTLEIPRAEYDGRKLLEMLP